MVKYSFILLFFIFLIGCVSEQRTNLPNFKIALNKYTLPSIEFEQYNRSIITENNIERCIYYKADSLSNDTLSRFKKHWALNFDKLGKVLSKEFYTDEYREDFGVFDKKNHPVILRDTSYWIGNKHYFEIVTDKERSLHFSEYKIKNNIGEKIYDSTFTIDRNCNTKFYVLKYDLDKDQILVNSNGRQIKKVFTYKKGKIIKIDYELMNSRCVKKDLFFYNSNGELEQTLYAYNNVLNDEIASVKKYIYNSYGLINYIKYYNVLSGDLKSFDPNKLDLVELNRLTEKFEWIHK